MGVSDIPTTLPTSTLWPVGWQAGVGTMCPPDFRTDLTLRDRGCQTCYSHQFPTFSVTITLP